MIPTDAADLSHIEHVVDAPAPIAVPSPASAVHVAVAPVLIACVALAPALLGAVDSSPSAISLLAIQATTFLPDLHASALEHLNPCYLTFRCCPKHRRHCDCRCDCDYRFGCDCRYGYYYRYGSHYHCCDYGYDRGVSSCQLLRVQVRAHFYYCFVLGLMQPLHLELRVHH